MLWVVAYDVHNDRRRRRVEKALRGYGFRVQYSVFECRIDTRKLERLQGELTKEIETEDRLRFYQLCESCQQKVRTVPEDDPLDSEPIVVL